MYIVRWGSPGGTLRARLAGIFLSGHIRAMRCKSKSKVKSKRKIGEETRNRWRKLNVWVEEVWTTDLNSLVFLLQPTQVILHKVRFDIILGRIYNNTIYCSTYYKWPGFWEVYLLLFWSFLVWFGASKWIPKYKLAKPWNWNEDCVSVLE